MENLFLNNVYKKDVYTENGALSNSTTGDELLNQFSKAATFRDRDEVVVFAEMSKIWAENPLYALYFVFYIRMVTRKSKGFYSSENVQKGQGVRDESFKRFKWIAKYHPEEFYKNMWLIPVVGTWKDLWSETLIDVLDRNKVYYLIAKGINDEYNKDLVAKYLPRIKSKSNCKNERHLKTNSFAKGLCKYLGWSETQYRQFKSTGKAHKFQRDITEGLYEKINWNSIPGKALFDLTQKRGKKDKKTFLERHGLEDIYVDWLKKQPTAKFTGYVYELFKMVNQNISIAQKITLDKQFDGLLELAKKDQGGIKGNVWCALDTSGSMNCEVVKNVSAYDICVSLGIFFSSLNEGSFKDHVIMFDNNSKKMKLSGSFFDKAMQIMNASTACGSTNFQSVIDEIVRVRQQNPLIPVEDYPQTLIVVSDMQFNPVGGNTQTNYESAMQKLASIGLPKIKIVWWHVCGRGSDFPSTISDEGVTMIGGFDPSVLTLILGGDNERVDEKTGETRSLTPVENMEKALQQDLLMQVVI